MTTLHTFTKLKPTLQQAQALVEGYVELVTLQDGSQLLVNEEGRLKHLEPNEEASQLYGGLIVGNAIHLKGRARWK